MNRHGGRAAGGRVGPGGRGGQDRREGREAQPPVVGGREWLYGRQSVLECLRAGRRKVHRLLLPPVQRAPGADELAPLRALAAERRVEVAPADPRLLERLSDGGHHQGVAAEVEPYPYVAFETLLVSAEGQSPPFLLIADHLQDPQNLGAILRTADAAGVTGVVIPKDRACGVTPAVVRASSGAAEHVPVACVVNLVRAMEKMKAGGIWLYGLDAGEGARRYDREDLRGPVGLVVGNEGKGLGRLVGETCDVRLRIPMAGRVASLNASVSAAVVIYEVVRQRGA